MREFSLFRKRSNGLALTSTIDGFTISGGGVTSRMLTVSGSNVSINQNLLTTSSPNFAGMTLNGNLGIGTATPSYKLDVQGTGAAGQVNAAGGLCIAGVCKTAWTDAGIGSSVWTTSGNDIYSSNTGNVGIGTTTPVSKLEIAGLATLTSIPTGTGVSQGALYINPASYTSSPIVQWTTKAAWNQPYVGGFTSPAFADLDGDGDLDMMLGIGSGVVLAYKNIGTNSSPSWSQWSGWNSPNIGMAYAQPALADLNNDGKIDLMIGGDYGVSYAYQNTGTVSAPVWTAMPSWNAPDIGNLAAPAFADLDSDGDYDLLIGGNGIAYAFMNIGTPFSPIWSASSGWNAPNAGSEVRPSIGDLDGDGDFDLMIGNSAGVTYGYKNVGSVSAPSWAAESAWNIGSIGTYSRPGLVDADNDGDMDILIGEWDGVVNAYENTGSVGAATNTIFGIAVGGSQKFKVNGLGNLNLLGSITSTNLISAAYNGTSDALTINQSGTGNIVNFKDGGTSAFMIKDGGFIGIGTTSPTAFLSIKAGTATAGTAPLKFTTGTLLSATEGGAMEFDGTHIYFTATNAGTRYQLDQQSGTSYSATNGLTLTANAFKLGGTLSAATDIALASNDLTFSGLGNIGIGTTTASYKLDVRGTAAAGQINAEGGLCINGVCKTSWTDSGIGISVWTTNGNDIYSSNTGNIGIGTTTPVSKLEIAGLATLTSIPTGTGVSQGALYINPASYSSNPIVSWAAKITWNTPSVGSNIAPAFSDLDSDGDQDVLIGDTDGACFAYENIGTASSPSWSARAGWNAPDVGGYVKPAFADLNGDGKIDLLIGDTSGVSYAYQNTGTISSPVWTAAPSWNVPNVGDLNASPAFADLNNDGRVDLLIGTSGGILYGYQNTGTTSVPAWSANSSWNAPSLGNSWTVPAFADLDGDGDKDLLVGDYSGAVYGYENTGTISSPVWTRRVAWDTPDTGFYSKPALADLDNDGDYDMVIGENGGVSFAYENTGSVGAATNTIFGVAVGGSEKLRVNGLGQLMLSGSFISSNLISTSYNGTSDALTINQSGSGNIVNFKDAGTSAFMIKDGGNVGIGTSSPTALLSVGSTSQFQINSTGNVTGGTYNALTLTAATNGFTIAGGTTSKTLTVPLDASVSGTNTGDNAVNTLYSGLSGSKQDALSGTGFVKISGTAISYDNSTYVTGTPWTGMGYLTSLAGAVLTSQTTPQTIGDTTNRLAKLWATDITVANAINGSVTGNAGTVTNATFTTTLANNGGAGVLTWPAAGATLTIPTGGGTLGSAAFTASGAYLPIGGGTLTGNLLFTDNTLDIGANGATRPRTGYFGTSIVSPLFNGLAITDNGTNTLNITAGKTLTVQDNVTISGALGTGAYATIGNYAPIGQTMYIGTTAHAINRGTGAEALTGITGLTPSANFVLTQNSVAALTSEETGALVNTLYLKAGNVGIGTNNPLYKLEVNGSARVSSLNINGAYSLPTAAGTTSQYLRGDGTWQTVSAGMSGSGTTNRLSKFTGSSTLGDSLIFDDGTNVGIGTSSPQAGLHVATSNIIFGSGYGGTPSDVYIKGPAAGGTDVTGSNMYFDASAGTGTASSGSLIFRSAIGLLSTTLTYDNSSTGNAGWANSLTFAHTVTTDSAKVDKLLVVAISDRVSVTGVTYGGTSMHSLGSYSDVVNVRMWYLKESELPTGANNVVISSSTSGQISAVAATFYNVDQTTNTFGTVAGTTAQFTGNISINVSSATNDMVMDVVGTADSGGYSATTPGAGQTAIARVLSNGDNGIATSREAGAATVTMSWSNSTSSAYRQAMMGVSIRAKRVDMGNALTERLRISPSGNVGIGTTNPTALLTAYNGTTTGTYTTSGWASSSDARLKTNIMDVTNPLDKIKALSGVYFNWNANPNSDRQIGLIAQDTLKVLPEVVVGNEKDGYGIAYGNLSALLIEGVKAQQTQLSSLSALTNSLQSSNNLQDNEIQKLNQALALLKTDNQDQTQITNQKISSIQNNLATAGSQINLLSTKLSSANALLSQNSQPVQELPFYQFKNASSELSSSLTEQVIENNQFSAKYSAPENFQELAINLGIANQLDLSGKDQGQSYLVYDVYLEDSASLEDFHTELGNIQDQKEIEWIRSSHPFFLSGWNQVRLPLTDGAKTGEIDWQHLNYFRAYFKLSANASIKFKNIRIETKASYVPLAQAIDARNLDLLNNIDQGTALKDIFGKLEIQALTNKKLDDNVSELSQNLKKMQDQLDLVQTQSQAVIDFALALNMDNLIYKDVSGNVNLGLGNLEATEVKAKKVKAEDYVVSENSDPLKNNVGSVIIRVGQQEVLVKNEKVMYDSKIIVTPVGSSPVNWVLSDKIDNVGFKIKLDKSVQFDIAFDYWVIGVEK